MVAIVILWVAFFFTHSLLAANSMKERAENFLGKRYIYYRLGYNIFSLVFLLLILYILLFRQEMNFVFHSSSVSSISGIMLMIVGVIITILPFRNYDLAEF